MDEVPLTVTVPVPSWSGIRYGRDGTSPPYGFVTSIRMHEDTIDIIDRARALVDPDLTRNSFMTMAIEQVAKAICRHNDAYLEWIKEKQHGHGTETLG